MVRLRRISRQIEKIAEEALILEPQLNYSREYQFHLEYVRNNSDILPSDVPRGSYLYEFPGVLQLFVSIFRLCSCQVGNIVDLRDFEDYMKAVADLVGEMERVEGEILFFRPIQEQ